MGMERRDSVIITSLDMGGTDEEGKAFQITQKEDLKAYKAVKVLEV